MTEPVSRTDRERLLGQRGVVAWLTGLSGSGKTTLALAAQRMLHEQGFLVQRLDGDDVRRGLTAGLGFSMEDRHENIRRLAEAARLHMDAGLVVIVAAISPTEEIREMARHIIGAEDFLEVYVNCSLECCETRDVKGMYRRARAGEIADFTGIGSSYEAPPAPDLVIDTDVLDIPSSAQLLADAVIARATPAPMPGA